MTLRDLRTDRLLKERDALASGWFHYPSEVAERVRERIREMVNRIPDER